MKVRAFIWAALLGMAGGASCLFAADEIQLPPPPGTKLTVSTQEVTGLSGTNSTTVPGTVKLSHGLDDIVRMIQSGAGTEVVLSFVENSPVAYSPSADEVIQLHKLGVPSPVIVALLRHGGELRDQQMQAAQTNRVPVATDTDYSSNSYFLPAAANSSMFVDPAFPIYTFSYPVWWFAGNPGFWFGYLWPYYNCGFFPRNSWGYVPPNNSRYPRGSWGYYSRTVNEPRAGWGYSPRPGSVYVARPAPPPVAAPPANYSTVPPSRGGATTPTSPAPRNRGR